MTTILHFPPYSPLSGIIMYEGSNLLLGCFPGQSFWRVKEKHRSGNWRETKIIPDERGDMSLDWLLENWHRIFSLSEALPISNRIRPSWGENHWKIILDWFTKDAESRYSPVEGEALTLIYGLEFCRKFKLGGLDLLVIVDHKSQVKIFSDTVLENIKTLAYLLSRKGR